MSIRDDIFSNKLEPEYALKQARQYIISIEERIGRQTSEMASLEAYIKSLQEYRFRVREAINTASNEAHKGDSFFGRF